MATARETDRLRALVETGIAINSELSLDGVPGLRRDVDTPEDLRAAVALGAGVRTAAVAGQLLAGT